MIEIRSNYLDSHSFLICLLCPYLLRVASIYRRKHHPNVLMRLILDAEPYFRPALMIFVVVCRLTNLQYIVIGQHYAIRKLVYPLLAFTVILTVSVFYETFRIKDYARKSKLTTTFIILEKIVFIASIIFVYQFCYVYRFKFNEYKSVWLIDHDITKFFIIYFVLSSVNLLKSELQYAKTSKCTLPLWFVLRNMIPLSFLIVINFYYDASNVRLFTQKAYKWTLYVAMMTILNQFIFYAKESASDLQKDATSNLNKSVESS